MSASRRNECRELTRAGGAEPDEVRQGETAVPHQRADIPAGERNRYGGHSSMTNKKAGHDDVASERQ